MRHGHIPFSTVTRPDRNTSSSSRLTTRRVDLSEISPYGPTAARKHERPGREARPRSTTVDIHSHVSVPAAAAIVQPHLDISTIPLAFFSTADTKKVNAQQEIDRYTRISGQENGLAEILNRPRCDGHRRSACDAATVSMLLHCSAWDQHQSDACSQRRHRRVCRAKARPLCRSWQRSDDRRQGGGRGTRSVDAHSWAERRPSPHEYRRPRTFRSRLRSILGKGGKSSARWW